MSTLLELRSLSKSFAGFSVLKDIQLELPSEGVYALIGPNGAGKTTLFNVISRVLDANSGEILFQGKSLLKELPYKLIDKGILRTFQLNSVFLDLSVAENLLSAFLSLKKDTHCFWKTEYYDSKVENILCSYGLEKFSSTQARNLSYGTRKILELAICEVFQPKLLLLDEPLAGVGLQEIEGIKKLILKLAKDKCVLLIDHNMSAVSELCKKIFVLHQGRIIASGTFQELIQNPEVKEAYLGASFV